VTYRATDAALNTFEASFTVKVNDTQNPTITAPPAVTALADPGENYASGVVLGTPATADNCTVASVASNAPATFPVGPTTVTWTVTDGSGNTATANQLVTVTPNLAATTTAIAGSKDPANINDVVTYTATVTSGATAVTTGSVRFVSNGVDLGTVALDASGKAAANATITISGSYAVTATYLGTTSYSTSSASLVQTVFGVRMSLTSSVNPSNVGQSTTLRATIINNSNNQGLRGQVNFYDGEILIGSANANSSGVATLSYAFATSGTHILKAVYQGTTVGFRGATAFRVQVVNAATMATVTTASVSAITSTGATSGGTVTSASTGIVTARGVCWSTVSGNAVATGLHTTNGSGTGTFTSSITGLVANTTYYVRAYATTAAGTAYGSEVIFTTTSGTRPTVTTTTASSIRNDRAQVGGNVTSSGSATVTERGVVYAKHSNVTTADTKRSSGTGTGSFSFTIYGLSSRTTYYYRAYAINAAGTSYGVEKSFTTSNKSGTLNDVVAGLDPVAEVIESSLKAYPNPSAGPVNFEFVVDADARVIMDLYTVSGARVATIFNADVPAGVNQTVQFSDNLAEGTYIYILRWNDKKMTGKLIIKH
jgi:hypothetical protein